MQEKASAVMLKHNPVQRVHISALSKYIPAALYFVMLNRGYSYSDIDNFDRRSQSCCCWWWIVVVLVGLYEVDGCDCLMILVMRLRCCCAYCTLSWIWFELLWLAVENLRANFCSLPTALKWFCVFPKKKQKYNKINHMKKRSNNNNSNSKIK